MKKNYAKKFKAYKNIKQYSLLAVVLMAFGFYSYGQSEVPFSSRANYSVKGDFTIIGNTNLAPANNIGNDTGDMFFVDVDNDVNTVNSSIATMQLKDDNGIVADDCANIVYAGLYWTGRPGPDQSFTVPGNNGIPKTLNKSVVSISGPASSGYTNITANASDIYYPESEYANMYIAYADVTSYVQQNGAGDYSVADIALVEGQENPTVTNIGVGYYGGWSMVIVYENSTMKMRNIGVFDGYSFKGVPGDIGYETRSHIDLDISNLNVGDYVNAQLGVMAGEGDDDLSGDLLSTQWGGTGTYRERLTHPGNSEFNFFNSTIEVGGSPRNPSGATYGLDLSKFDLPTASVVPNQNDLSFEYISVLDKFVIYNLTLSFEAPDPGIEAEVAITNINGTPNNSETTTVEPGQDITYTVDIKNFGTEGTTNNMLSIPVPFNTTFSNIVSSNGNGTPTYNSSTNTIDWSLGNIPQQTNTDNIVATVTFTVTTTTDCTLLVVDCANSISLNGAISGTGSVSGTSFDKSLITGYETAAGCLGTPIPAPIYTSIVNANCANTPLVQTFEYCAPPVPFTDISSTYPQGTRFYNEYPVTSNSTEYTSSNAFPTTNGAISYYAVPANSEDCSFEFIIDISPISTLPVIPTDPIVYCLDETAVPLTATASNPSYTLYYYNDNTESAQAFTSITPNTDVAGTTTYYVAEGPTSSPECIGDKAAITVTVNALLDIQTDITNASCAVGSDGSIDITVTGGSGNYTYLWSTTATTEDITGLVPGVYSVTVTDADFGCETILDNITVLEDVSTPTLTAPPAYTLEGCDVSAITDLPVSTTPLTLTIDQLQTAGGTADEFLTLTYTDVVLGTCPTVVTRTFTATNNCNNSVSATQTITIEDTVAPTVPTAPVDITLECSDALPPMVDLTAIDNCGSNPAITVTGIDTTDSTDACRVITTRTWTFTDACGNTSSTSQIITIVDETAPIAPANLADITVSCIDDIPAPAVLTAIDNCSGIISGIVTDSALPTESCNASILRTWSFTDDCGNTSVTTQTVNIVDDIAPIITNEPQDIVYQCDGEQKIPQIDAWVELNGFGLANDNCSDVTWTSDYDATTLGCNGAVTVAFTATDACGNATTRSATYTVLDTTGPDIVNNSQDISIVCGDANDPDLINWLATNGGAIAQDICSETTWTNDYDSTLLDGGSDVTVTFTATDECGNASTTTSSIIITDSVAPVAPAAPANETVQCIDDVPTMEALTAIDNCAGPITSLGAETINDTDECNVIITRTWSFSDNSGNTSEVSQIITVKDETAPVANNVPADVTLDCNAIIPAMEALTATDNCAGTITSAGTEVVDNTDPSQTIITRTWSFTDTCGNTSEASQIITFIIDNTAPVVDNAPADITYECIDDVPAMEALTAIDDCVGTITSTGTESINDTDDCNVIITRTWSFSDNSGNTSEVSQIITVRDETAPVADNVPADMTLDCNANVPTMEALTATDNCAGTITSAGTEVIDTTNPLQTIITRTWSFTDTCGNTSEVSQIISFNLDETAPVVDNAPADITVECIDDVPAMEALTATDNCSGTITSNGVESIDDTDTCNVIITRIWTFTDASGNTSEATQIITVIDTIAPVVPTLPADVTVDSPADLPPMVDLTATDNCGADVIATPVDATEVIDACTTVITRTWSFEDACGNLSTGSQIITISDMTPPELISEAQDIVYECDGEQRNVTIDAWVELHGFALAEDAISNVTWTSNYDPDYESCNEDVEVIFTATDDCGNSVSTSATYTIKDETGPFIQTAPQDLVFECSEDSDSAISDWLNSNGGAVATDFCSDVTWSNDFDASTIDLLVACGPDNSTTVTFSATDFCGNVTTTTSTITVMDETAPIVPTNVPADVAVKCYDDVPATVNLTATDNCSSDITVTGIDTEDNTDPNNIIITRTWTFTDACGNTSDVSQIITVQDLSAPVLDGTVPADVTLECIADVPAMEPLTATDNCAGVITSNGTETINDTDACNVIITRTWSFADASGNTTDVSQIITVNDTNAPVVNNAPQDLVVECTDGTDVPPMGPLTATDNCAGEITAEGTEVIDDSNPLQTVITRTWSFADACGNTTEVSQTITVGDSTAPVVDNAPSDATYACIDDVPELAPLTATDNCVGEITDNGTETINDADACNVIITRTWMFTDASNNSTTVTQVITVIDDVAPTATAPADVTVECTDDIPAMIDLIATDNCGDTITSTGVDTVNDIDSCSSIITRTWSFTDACGNTANVSQIITVADVTAPILVSNLETDITVNCIAIPEKPELDFTDNCSATVDVVYTEENTSTGAAYENYQVIRDWTVSDSCGNTAMFTQTINVNVQQETIIEADTRCTEGGSVDLDSYLVDPDTDGTWTVDSGNATVNGSIFNPIDAAVGAYVFTFTEADTCQNQTTVTIDVNEDCVAPTCEPIISSSVTPNGDQWNEYFTVTGLDRCGFVIDVEIYNRWGSLVFKAQDYQNNWNGRNGKGGFGSSDILPTGTYYYIVTLKNSGLKPLTGPIYLGTK
ncbi:gliding motility-associated C-terminal domain-containing protein [Formosa undariae]|uniref:Gliding motility-associated C-terminal domain-containing protein n=1 Tax=Formosa undariae TaxID=1325436 RepID=A0ABV5F470_9FLAO